VIVWLAVVLWLVIVAWSLALMRAAGAGDAPASARGAERDPGPRPEPAAPALREGRRRATAIGQAVLLAIAVAVAALVSEREQWSPPALVALLALLTLGSDLIVLDAKRFRIGGSFLGTVLAMAVLGPAPAVALALTATAADALRSRPRGTYLLNNLVTHATFPLLGGLILHALRETGTVEHGGFAVAVFAVFVLANILNFAMIAGHTVWLRGGSLQTLFRTVYLPVLPWELATASITAMAVYGFELYGTGMLGLLALALGVSQLLLRALLEGHAHGEEVVRRTDQLDVRHEGMVGLLLETLALRDPTAARHAAAVAHYAYELARAAGLSERERAIVHTAGLLHDIGKEAFPDFVLRGGDLHADERGVIERHPADGARLLLRVEGLGEVATAVLAHHERLDGHGYPDALAGDDIPVAARILAVAEVYDVLTAPDSYRLPVSPVQAEEELRRVAGTQLDGRLVFLFLTRVLRRDDDEPDRRVADLEAELLAQRRMRGALDEPLVLDPST
jgi:putative nucleotidyltransferase with HDIG domain